MMNKDKLKSIIAKKSKSHNDIAAQLYQMFFFEKILERISKSRYKNNIILKGGLLLSSIIGEDERTTKDMDATLKSLPLEKEYIFQMMNDILCINLNDEISFEIVSIKDIRLEDEYGGFRISILALMDTLKIHLAIELTTGDKITPREIEYYYSCIFEDKKILILAYTLETVIAEKYHSIATRGVFNTRMKDFYDLYILMTENKEKIDFNNLDLAIRNTFRKRETDLSTDEIIELIGEMRVNQRLISLWRNYQISAPYSNNIKYEDLFDTLGSITEIFSDVVAI